MPRRSRLALPCALAALALAVPASASAQSGGSVQPRVIGGSTASISTYPWQAAVVFSPSKVGNNNAHRRQFCAGSLITSRIVITAGHCVFDTDPDCSLTGGVNVCLPSDPGGDGTKRLDPNDVDVVLGRTTLSDTTQGQEFTVQAVKLGTSFDGNYQGDGVPRFDAAYLVLSAPAALTPIKIAGADEGALWADGSPEDISGWGSTTESGGTVDSLRAATVNIVPDATCNAAYTPDFDPATMVCAGVSGGGVDTCAGDSGGPLEAPLQGGGYRLVGLTGWGEGCARADFPGVYTRVAGATMRPIISSDVTSLESAQGLAPENIFGSGGQPRVATPSGSEPALAPVLRKCKRIHDKKKRRRCVKRAKARASSLT